MRVHVLGDTHLGRRFVNGVSLTRRGERETMMMRQFADEVSKPEVDLHVHLGDLFDAAVVSYDVILKVADVYRQAAKDHPDCTYLVLRGNHDIYRDLTRKSAFDMFEALMEGQDNIVIVKDRALRLFDRGFVGYSVEGVDLPVSLKGCHTLYGHFDVESFGGDDHNLVPTKLAAELGISSIVTGHIHKPQRLTRDGVDVTVHGSMQPFSHGEEINDDLYVTLSLDDLEGKSDAWLKNRCVRVLGVPEREIDCLSLTIKRLDADAAVENPTVELGGFDLDALFKESFSEAGVPEDLQAKVFGEYQARRLMSD